MLRAELGLSVTELGLLLAALNVTTVLAQPPIGVLVDRYGPGLILIAGQIAFALGIGLAGLGTGLASLLPLMVLAGLGNAVYHPADYAILSARVSPGRTARAFSIHTFGGYAGFAAAPVVMVTLTALVGWRTGLLLIGAAGLVMAAVLIAARGELAASVARKKEQGCGRHAGTPDQPRRARRLRLLPAPGAWPCRDQRLQRRGADRPLRPRSRGRQRAGHRLPHLAEPWACWPAAGWPTGSATTA